MLCIIGFCVVFGWLGLSAKAGLFSLVERVSVRGIALACSHY